MAAVATEGERRARIGPNATLSVGLCLVASCGGAPPGGRAVTADVRTALYQDSDHTTIGTVATAVRARPTEELTIAARNVVDVTTTASVDVISAATHRWDEPRSEVMGGVGLADGTASLDVAYTYSAENDWWSHTAAAGGSIDLDDHRVTLSLGGSYGYNDIGRASDPTFSREMHTATGRAGIVWVATPEDLWSLGYDLGVALGYQESPYRYARFRDVVSDGLLQTSPESVPDLRMRHAVTLRWAHAISADVSLRSHARLYGDDWGVMSATGGTEIRGALGEWELGFSARLYAQLGATFFRDVYTQPQRYMTSDRELSPFWDVFAGPVLSWRAPAGPFSELHFEARATGFAFQFLEFSRLPERFGIVGELALGGSL